ncbi:MAG: hypothetical protein ACK4MM_06245 [Fervidobacterium sp.]
MGSNILNSLLAKSFQITIIALLLITSTLIFSNTNNATNPVSVAIEGASLLKKSREAFFPLNILYYYVGINQLSYAISKDPTNLDIRLIRATALFDFVEKNTIVQDIIIEDLEFFLLFKDKYPYSSKISIDILYYMLSYIFAMKQNNLKAYYYFEKLQKQVPESPLIQKLENTFPKYFQRP